ncbi:hypothetical protein ABT297_36970 [Dactylosporangium sp. NPDC000555]|uniref:hypothetical protein n=1 Tax=Dactylosporangium sp. NPDC000555 TaxID=3154260 RepID=UPI00332E75D8
MVVSEVGEGDFADAVIDDDDADFGVFQSHDQAPVDLLRRAGYLVEEPEVHGYRSGERWGNWYRFAFPSTGGRDRLAGLLPHVMLPALVEESDRGWVIHKSALGLSSRDGRYVELLLSRFGLRFVSVRPSDYVSPRTGCATAHSRGESYCTSFTTAYVGGNSDVREMGKLFPRAVVHFHVGDGRGTCIEISSATATLAAVYMEAADRIRRPDIEYVASVKVKFPENLSSEAAMQRARSLAGTFFFELAALRQAHPRLHEPLLERDRVRSIRPAGTAVRFPPQSVDARAGSLFVSADGAGSPLSRYLAYYQSIEYFLPYSDERSSIAKLKREVFSPGFDLSRDASLLSLVRTIGRQTSRSERESFKDLITLVLPLEKAKAIFEGLAEQYPDHFSKRGKVQHVTYLHPADATRAFPMQIADRIYDLRCRIVHSKAMGGAVGAEPLFPTDDEVAYVGADVELVRLVAMETITAFASGTLSP